MMKKTVAILMLGLVTAATAGVFAWRHYQPRSIAFPSNPIGPVFAVVNGEPRVEVRAEHLLAEVATSSDELLAWLSFGFLRTRAGVDYGSVLLTAETEPGQEEASYRIYLLVNRDLLQCVPMLERLKASGFIVSYRLLAATATEVAAMRSETGVFEWAYNLPVRQRMESLGPSDLGPILAKYILFKSRTDPRVRRGDGLFPQPLDRLAAMQFAGDILMVSRLYDLPVDFFLGIGAMENNYMDVYGDLQHGVWKRRAHPGDVVLARRNGRVRVWNYSTGVWQITRETLRFAHKLYLEDESRDYKKLPAELRPERELDLNPANRRVLTTYAGILFRHLLDYFEGDVEKAVGAYNGGKVRPNLDYARGVTGVARHARKVVEQTISLPGDVTSLQLLRPATGTFQP